jgi:penicillin-binding protein 2
LLLKKILLVLLLSNYLFLPLFSAEVPVKKITAAETAEKDSKKINSLQKQCETILGGRNGCIGILDLKEEKIITIVNPGLFKTKAVKPGSLIKILLAISALNSGMVNPADLYYCNGEAVFHESKFKCWTKKGHQKTDMVKALAESCNIYFYHIASKLLLSDIYRTYRLFDFGKRSPFNLSGESPGLFKETDSDIEKYYLAAGRSENLLVTPAKMLYFISVIAKRGRLLDSKINLQSKTYDPIYNGLRNSILIGTSQEANYTLLMPAGKTGTFSEQYTLQTSAWFIGYAPFNNPEIAIVIYLEKGRGASDAAPIAKQVFKCYYELFHQ